MNRRSNIKKNFCFADIVENKLGDIDLLQNYSYKQNNNKVTDSKNLKKQSTILPLNKNIQKLGHTKCFSNRPFISRQDRIWKLNCK